MEEQRLIPKAPIIHQSRVMNSYRCPKCNGLIGSDEVPFYDKYCRDCGQAIYWEEKK